MAERKNSGKREKDVDDTVRVQRMVKIKVADVKKKRKQLMWGIGEGANWT